MAELQVADGQLEQLRKTLLDTSLDLPKRFRCIFTLKNIGGKKAIDALVEALQKDTSALLKHECAYCLGQMGDTYANPFLIDVLKNTQENPMVRHEAAEALGAIASPDVIPVLEHYLHDSFQEVSETCQIALDRIKWVQTHDKSEDDIVQQSPFASVDPAPPEPKTVSTADLKRKLLDTSLPLFKRYRALFALRDKGDEEAVLAMAEGLNDPSALFRHEVAFVFGQLQHPASVKALIPVLENLGENPMVRHEAAEAIGSIATDTTVLQRYVHDQERAVKESCVIALDLHDYFTTDQFQYADGLVSSTTTTTADK